ncbi:MAG TPA: cyclase family protein [Dehalococcoidia bacterium]|nr:cyclase family protein [Dehalococcoidia bacterium]
MRIFDVSVPIRDGMIVYDGDPAVRLARAQSMADGALCNVSELAFGVHTGTHIDAPLHFIDGAPGVDELPLDALIGACVVVDATAVEGDIDARALERLAMPGDAPRVLLKTRNSALWSRAQFSRDFAGLTRDAAALLVARGMRLVGIDYLSIAPPADPAPTHVELLRAGVVILEGLDLRDVAAGAYRLVCLPLRLAGADGAPARAVLIEE